ncbi:response regulator transcription factor [Candidatus Kaiserbacteria bacterium]|nr:response regulator transcription factor [Candidatus Kaiserbacteria bacterium]
MRVLLVESDPTTARSLELMLTQAAFSVYCTDLGDEGVELAKLYEYDLVLLEIYLPDMSGHEVIRQLRRSKITTPVLVLSSNDSTESKIKAFGLGADDYVTKPFHREELVARMLAIIRRTQGHTQSAITTGKLRVNLDTKTVEVEGARVPLTKKEYQLLELLSLRKGTTVTRDMLMNRLYNGRDEPDSRIVDAFVCRLRKQISNATNGEHYIETAWGRGYVLHDPTPA